MTLLEQWTLISSGIEEPNFQPEAPLICPACGITLGLHYGQRGGKWFIAHPPATGRCKWSACTWRSTDKEDCVRFFHEEAKS